MIKFYSRMCLIPSKSLISHRHPPAKEPKEPLTRHYDPGWTLPRIRVRICAWEADFPICEGIGLGYGL